MKQTAVEWLATYLKGITSLNCDEVIEQAKAMEKEQILEAHGDEQSKLQDDGSWKTQTSEQYYNETFNTEEREFMQINQDNPVTKGSTTLVRTFNTNEK
jgi:hypothetical protein